MPRTLQDTKDQILRAAGRLIAVKGYRSTSLDDLLRECGIGRGTFYYHFRSKENLGYAIVGRIVQSFFERTLEPPISDASIPPLERITRFLDRGVEVLRQRNCVGGCPMGSLASEFSDVHEGFRQRLAAAFRDWGRRLVNLLEEAQVRGEISAHVEPHALGHFIVAALEGGMLMSKVTKEIAVMEQCVAQLKAYLGFCAVGLIAGTAPGPPRKRKTRGSAIRGRDVRPRSGRSAGGAGGRRDATDALVGERGGQRRGRISRITRRLEGAVPSLPQQTVSGPSFPR